MCWSAHGRRACSRYAHLRAVTCAEPPWEHDGCRRHKGPVQAGRCQCGERTHLTRVGPKLPRKRAPLCPGRPPLARCAAVCCWAVSVVGVPHWAQPPRLLLQQRLGGAAHRRTQACPAAPPPSISTPRSGWAAGAPSRLRQPQCLHIQGMFVSTSCPPYLLRPLRPADRAGLARAGLQVTSGRARGLARIGGGFSA